jgi:toxin ParE1/3/4
MSPRRFVTLTRQAEADFVKIIRWTADQFGMRQARSYSDTIRHAVKALENEGVIDAHQRPELGCHVGTLHVARQGRKGRHLLMFRVDEQAGVIEILRILHDSMDLQRHLAE